MFRRSILIRFLVLSIAILLTVGGCSRVGIAYNTANPLVKGYAKEYLGLDSDQLARWEPTLVAELERHRVDELPHLAAFFDQFSTASRAGFDRRNTACLVDGLEDLYRRQARVAVALASPLLVDLTPSQRERLAERFRDEAEKDRAELAERDVAHDLDRRARRYIKAIEDWTGTLSPEQQAIVADVTVRMPDVQSRFVDYRSQKRTQLIALIDSGASRTRIERFLTDWLVEFRDLPPDIGQARDQLGERIGELLVRLGASLEATQRDRLDKRLKALRDDFMRLQKQPRMVPLSC